MIGGAVGQCCIDVMHVLLVQIRIQLWLWALLVLHLQVLVGLDVIAGHHCAFVSMAECAWLAASCVAIAWRDHHLLVRVGRWVDSCGRCVIG